MVLRGRLTTGHFSYISTRSSNPSSFIPYAAEAFSCPMKDNLVGKNMFAGDDHIATFVLPKNVQYNDGTYFITV